MNINGKENIIALLCKANASITDLIHSELFAERWRYLKKYVQGAVKTRAGSSNPWKIKAGESKSSKDKDKTKPSKTKAAVNVERKAKSKVEKKNKLNPKEVSPKKIATSDNRAPSVDFTGTDTLGRVWKNGKVAEVNQAIPLHPEITGTINVGDKYRILTKEENDLLDGFRDKYFWDKTPHKSDYIGYLDRDDPKTQELINKGLVVLDGNSSSSYKVPKNIMIGKYVEEGYITKDGNIDIASPNFDDIIMTLNKDRSFDSQLNSLGFTRDPVHDDYHISIWENQRALKANKATENIAHEIRGLESLSKLESSFLDKADAEEKSSDIFEKIKKDRSELVDKVFNLKKDAGQNKRFKSYFERSCYESVKFELEHQMKFAGPRKVKDLKEKLDMVNNLYDKESDLLDQLSKTRLDNHIKTYKDNSDIIKKNITGEPLKFKVHVLPEDGVSKEDIDTVNRGVEIVRGLFSNTNNPMNDVVIKINNTDGRANSETFGAKINLFKGTSLKTVIHEIMHQIEDQNPDIHQAVKDFRSHRIGIKKPERIFDHDEELMNERGVEDQFGLVFEYNAKYVGKEYGSGSTEILSMGIPKLLENPKEFIRNDPEYARFLLGVMTGKIRRNGDRQ